MARLIDADALRVRMYHEAFETDTDMQKWDSGCWIRYKLFENCIDEMPTISPDDVRGVGEWEDNYPILCELECLRCKNCNKLVQIGRYCANCGERKKGAEDSE